MTADRETPEHRERRLFRRRIGQVAAGTGIGHLLALAVLPLITRMFPPDDFAALGLFSSFVGIGAGMTTLRYEAAITAADTDEQAHHLTLWSLVAAAVISPFLALGFVVMQRFSILGYGALPTWWYLPVTLGLFAMGGGTALRFRLIRDERFGPVAWITPFQSVIRGVAQVLAGFASLGSVGLVAGELLARVFTLAHCSWALRTSLLGKARVTLSAVRETLWRYRDYPRIALLSAVLDSAALLLPVPLLATTYGDDAAGSFTLVQRAVTLPVAFLAVAVSDVFFGALSRARREAPATMPKIFARTAVGLSGVGIALALGLVLVAPPLFPFLFGNEWATAGLLAAAMAPMALAQTIVSPLSRTVAALEAQRSKLIYDVVAVSCTVLSIWLCHSRGMDLVNTMIVFAACRALTYVVYLLVLWVIVRRAAKELG